jgi:hypothetical protein
VNETGKRKYVTAGSGIPRGSRGRRTAAAGADAPDRARGSFYPAPTRQQALSVGALIPSQRSADGKLLRGGPSAGA